MIKEAELKDDKYLKRLYSSRMRIKRRVLKMERVAARELSLIIDDHYHFIIRLCSVTSSGFLHGS